MKIKKLGALLVLAALCAGMAAPAFAFEGEAAPVEQPVLPEVVEEDVVTITDETSGALTPEGNLTLVDITTHPTRTALASSSLRWCQSREPPSIWSLTATPKGSRPSTL